MNHQEVILTDRHHTMINRHSLIERHLPRHNHAQMIIAINQWELLEIQVEVVIEVLWIDYRWEVAVVIDLWENCNWGGGHWTEVVISEREMQLWELIVNTLEDWRFEEGNNKNFYYISFENTPMQNVEKCPFSLDRLKEIRTWLLTTKYSCYSFYKLQIKSD